MAASSSGTAAGAALGASSSASVRAQDARVASLLTEAIQTWQDLLCLTETPEVHLVVQDLADSRLAESVLLEVDDNGLPALGRITIDADGGGAGWHVDSATLPGEDRYDLYTVLLHELAHVMGFSARQDVFARLAEGDSRLVGSGPEVEARLDSSGQHLDAEFHPDDLMNATLATGQRRLPSALDATVLAAIYDAPQPDVDELLGCALLW